MDKNNALKEVSKCKSVDEVIKLAKSNNIELSKEKAEDLFKKAHSEGQLSETELNNVSGGASCNNFSAPPENRYEAVDYPSKEAVIYMFNVGDEVTFYKRMSKVRDEGTVYTGKIQSRKAVQIGRGKWYDAYCIWYDDERNKNQADYDVYRSNIVKK